MVYEHPQYTPESLRAQQQILALGDDRLAFAGAYHGWGFHEDGALSGVRAAERLGRELGRRRRGPERGVPRRRDRSGPADAAAEGS